MQNAWPDQPTGPRLEPIRFAQIQYSIVACVPILEATPHLRVTAASGAVQLDPRQAEVPSEWQALPAFALESAAKLTIASCTFNDNHALGQGGGLNLQTTLPCRLTNVTLSGNGAVTDGGGLGVTSHADATLTNVTVTGNSAPSAAGLRSAGGTLIVRHTIVASNSGGNSAYAAAQQSSDFKAPKEWVECMLKSALIAQPGLPIISPVTGLAP